MILIAIPSASRDQPARNQPAPPGIGPVPAGQTGQDRSEHQGVRLKGAAVANGERKDREGKGGQEGGPLAAAAAYEIEKPPRRQRHDQGRDNSSGRPHAQSGHSPQIHDDQLVDRRLDDEVVGKGRRVELWPEESRAPFEVARDHRRRDLASHVVLDDRLVRAPGPNQERQGKQDEEPARDP